jgi:hypothetical protein
LFSAPALEPSEPGAHGEEAGIVLVPHPTRSERSSARHR